MNEMTRPKGRHNRTGSDRIGKILSLCHLFCVFIAFAITARLVYLQFGYEPDERTVKYLTPRASQKVIEPARGAILAEDGRTLAMSKPIYDIYLDCTVKKSYEKDGSEKMRRLKDSIENSWDLKAQNLAAGLKEILGTKSTVEYYDMLRKGRDNDRKYVKICTGVDRNIYNRLRELPLFNEGRNNGGIIVNEKIVRLYPYGKLARRTIGFVRDNEAVANNNYVGIEGKFNSYLHGLDGVEYLKKISPYKRVHDNDSIYVKAVDGSDVRTTLNIDYQDIADAALREQIEDNPGVEGGCAILMEVKTGAIRAMVNLMRDSTSGKLEEFQNFAVGRLGEPGSVFKPVTLTTVLEDKKIHSLDDSIPTNHGLLKGYRFKQDIHIPDYEREHKTNFIPVIDGLEMSSNYVFQYLAIKHYGDKPKEFIDRIYSYKLGEAFDFDIDGLRAPNMLSDATATTIGSLAYGYGIAVTPLHIVTFYNAIANKGRMMKPYLVEDIEKNGQVIEKRGPSVLNATICSKATADTLTRGLISVTEEGTAYRLKGAKCQVAGKTGTARISLPDGGYQDASGRHKNQGTFVGFFPADNPKYSIIVSIYSGLTAGSFYGGTLPAAAVRTIVDKIFTMDNACGEVIEKGGNMPVMKTSADHGKQESGIIPDVRGMGLYDALDATESAGYRCSWSGIGHVRTQSPKPGQEAIEGTEIKIVLK